MISIDTNLFVFAANPASKFHKPACEFFRDVVLGSEEIVICELALVEVYMQLRNPAVFKKGAYSAAEAASYCNSLKKSPAWRCIDYVPEVSSAVWSWAEKTESGFRQIIDARLALTLRHHGVTTIATKNTKDFQGFGFTKVWDPIS